MSDSKTEYSAESGREHSRANRWTYADVVKLHVGRKWKLALFRLCRSSVVLRMLGKASSSVAIVQIVIRESKGGLVEQQRGGKGLQVECSREGVSQVGVSSWGAWS